MSERLSRSTDELLAGYRTYTAADDIVAAGAENNTHIIMTITIGETTILTLTPDTPASTAPCWLA